MKRDGVALRAPGQGHGNPSQLKYGYRKAEWRVVSHKGELQIIEAIKDFRVEGLTMLIISSLLSFAIGFLIARSLYLNSPQIVTSPEPLNISEVVKIKEVDSVSQSTNQTGKTIEVSEVVSSDHEIFFKKRKKKFKDNKGLKLETLLSDRFEKGEIQSEVNSPSGGK